MLVKQLIAKVKGVPVWALLEGSGNPADNHTITAIIIDRFTFGNVDINKVPEIIDVDHAAIVE